MEGTPFARHASKRRHGTLEGVPETKVGWSTGRFEMALGRFHSAILPSESRDEKRQWDLRRGLGRSAKPAGGREGVRWRPRRIRRITQACSAPRLRSLEPAKPAAVMFSVHKI